MSPQAYIQAREQKLEWLEVDEKPYLPLQRVDGSDMDSVRKVVGRIFIGEAVWKKETEANNTERMIQGLSVAPVLGGITNTLFLVLYPSART
jgi:hypothetical protein